MNIKFKQNLFVIEIFCTTVSKMLFTRKKEGNLDSYNFFFLMNIMVTITFTHKNENV